MEVNGYKQFFLKGSSISLQWNLRRGGDLCALEKSYIFYNLKPSI
jgi:hypothetical protein